MVLDSRLNLQFYRAGEVDIHGINGDATIGKARWYGRHPGFLNGRALPKGVSLSPAQFPSPLHLSHTKLARALVFLRLHFNV